MTREELLQQGYISIGEHGGKEYLVRKAPDLPATILYHMVHPKHGVVWPVPKSIHLTELAILNTAAKTLFGEIPVASDASQ